MLMENHRGTGKKKQNVEFRYYEMPSQSYLLALLGERWIMNYGTEAVHFHNYLEIGYCYYGEGHMMLEGENFEYRGQMFTVIPKSCPHCTRSEQQQISRWEYLFIDVEGFLKEVYKERPGMQKKLVSRLNGRPVIASCGQYPQIAGLIRNILEEMREKQEFHKESIRGYLLALLVELARKSEEGEETLQSGGDEKRIAVVLDYIAEKFAEDIKVSDLAALCHVSETHFRRIFEKMMNVSPAEYMNMIRIQHACTLLKETRESVETVREKVGFSTASTFNRNFQKMVQMSPRQWRNQEGSRLVDYKISIYKGW